MFTDSLLFELKRCRSPASSSKRAEHLSLTLIHVLYFGQVLYNTDADRPGLVSFLLCIHLTRSAVLRIQPEKTCSSHKFTGFLIFIIKSRRRDVVRRSSPTPPSLYNPHTLFKYSARLENEMSWCWKMKLAAMMMRSHAALRHTSRNVSSLACVHPA